MYIIFNKCIYITIIEKIISRLTRNYVKNCLKANTEGCPEAYDRALSQNRAAMDRIEGICGDLCLSRTGELIHIYVLNYGSINQTHCI